MGLFKIFVFTAGPVSYLVYSTFKLGPKLPIACRQFGNMIGLSYVYFKVFLKTLKPQNQLGMEIVDIVRKTSQQSKALKREINSQFRKVSQDAKKDLGIDEIQEAMGNNEQDRQTQETQKTTSTPLTGTSLMHSIQIEKRSIDNKKKAKAEANKFFTQI